MLLHSNGNGGCVDVRNDPHAVLVAFLLTGGVGSYFIYSYFLLPTVFISRVSLTCGQPQSENIKWRIPETNNSHLNSVPFQGM